MLKRRLISLINQGVRFRRVFSLERIANIGVLLTCAYVATLAYGAYDGSPRQHNAGAFVVGEQTPHMLGVDFSVSRRTVVLAVRSTCQYCTASMPFYKRLAAIRGKAPSAFQFVILGDEQPDALKNYLDSHGLRPDKLVSYPANSSPIQSTPSLAIVDSQGVVRASWTGVLSDRSEGVVLKEVTQAP